MADSFRRKQTIGLIGGAAAFVVLAVLFSAAPHVFAGAADDDTATRLAFATRWLLAPGATLLAGVVVAGRRGFLSDAIDGTRTPASHSLEINLRYNQNTLEQTVLAAIAWLGLALALPQHRLYLIPAMAAAFVLGRISFWIGYLVYPMGRAFGMVLTAFPTLAAYAWLLWKVFRRG